MNVKEEALSQLTLPEPMPMVENKPEMEKAVVLLSGGLDSATVLTMAIRDLGPKNVFPISFHYGQKHSSELQAAERLAGFFGCLHKIVEVPQIFGGYGSTLIDPDKENPHMTYKEIEEDFGVSPTYVPYRNGVLLSLATAYALTVKASRVYIGTHAEDSRNWAYPDCTPEWNGAMANAVYVGTYHAVRLFSPLQWLMKSEIVLLGAEYSVPWQLTLSCYEGAVPACGKCPTCVERIEAFKNAGFVDPIKYDPSVSLPWQKKS